MKRLHLFLLGLLFLAFSCSNEQGKSTEAPIQEEQKTTLKLVSLNGTLSELLCLYGLEDQIVGVDVTSTYPASLQSKTKVGHNRNISTEGILGLAPDVVLGIENEIAPAVQEALQTAGTKLILFPFETSPEGTVALANALKDSLSIQSEISIRDSVFQPLEQIIPFGTKPKVLFIYARGTGTMMVAGKNTSLDKMIKLSGAENAVQDFEDFKPLTPEALAAANPDVLLLFSSGLESLEGNSGLLQIPGVAETNAGKNEAIITMDGQYLSGFGPRAGKAALDLNQQIHQLIHD